MFSLNHFPFNVMFYCMIFSSESCYCKLVAELRIKLLLDQIRVCLSAVHFGNFSSNPMVEVVLFPY